MKLRIYSYIHYYYLIRIHKDTAIINILRLPYYCWSFQKTQFLSYAVRMGRKIINSGGGEWPQNSKLKTRYIKNSSFALFF